MAVLLATMDLNFQQMPSILAQPYGTLRSLMKVSEKTEEGHIPLDHLIPHHYLIYGALVLRPYLKHDGGWQIIYHLPAPAGLSIN